MDYPSRSSSADPLSQPRDTKTASHLPRKLANTILDNGMDTDEPSSSEPAGLGAYADDAPQNPSNNEEGREGFLSTLHPISSPRHRPASRMRTQDEIAQPASRGDVHGDTAVPTPKLPNDDQDFNVYLYHGHHPFPAINLAPPTNDSQVEKQTQSSSSTPTQQSPSLKNDSSNSLEQGTESQQGTQSQQGTPSQQPTQSQQHQAKPTDQSKPAEPSADEPAADEGEPSDALTPLSAFDWDGLEAEFEAKMQECQDREDGFVEEFETWFKVFQQWTTAARGHETERARKRLRTREAWVQISEDQVEKRRMHLQKCVEAFQSAMELLRDD
ncbi:MAG: hypothetical protein OHK93_007475 [Ramalina farinacea]|uniref:Uncharacterized protein n=1 Tax=Ramalina farinacea TaxID=258253 RepID=A0AA43QNF4_9LECA|nr:hypothetical protein [Ramalina farinacea]